VIPLGTLAIVGAWVAVAAVQLAFGALCTWPAAARMGAFFPDALRHGDPSVLFSAGLLHNNLVHLGGNLVTMLAAGIALERTAGAGRVLAIFVLTSACGFLLLALASSHPGLGGSAGIFGVGAFLAISAGRRRAWPLLGFALALLSLMAVERSLTHVGGAVAGAAIALVDRGGHDRRWRLVGVGLLALAIASVAHAGARHGLAILRAPPTLVVQPLGETGLTITVPENLVPPRARTTADGQHVFELGTFGDPMLLDIRQRAFTAMTLDDLRLELAAGDHEAEAAWDGKPQIVDKRGRGFVYQAGHPRTTTALRCERWAFVQRGSVVEVRVFWWADVSPAWHSYMRKVPELVSTLE
jgi:membrane associated rhomboid family serine protease